MIESIALDCQITRNSQSIVSDMEGEKVMLNVANGKYYNLGSVGGRIWELMDEPITAKQLVARLTSEYDVEPELCEAQVVSFLQLLSEEGLVTVFYGGHTK